MLHIIISLIIRYFIDLIGFNVLSNRVEVSTPLNSWKRLQECVALLDNKMSPYESDSCHAIPLLVWAISYIGKLPTYAIILIYWLFDVHCAYFLSKATERFIKHQVDVQKSERNSYAEKVDRLLLTENDVVNIPRVIRLCYLYNPFTILTCVGRTSTVLINLFIALTLFCMSTKSRYAGLLFLSLAAYLDIYPCVLLIAFSLYCSNKKFSTKFWTSLLLDAITFTSFIGALLFSSYYLSGSWRFLFSTYGFAVSVPDLTPNVGLFWYFFTETFDHFRLFFLFVFILNPFVYVAPLSFRLREEPVFLFYLLLMIISIFKSYPCIGNSAFYLSFLPLWKHLFEYVRHSLVVGCSLAASAILAPVMWHLWMEIGSANANFYFAITLVYSTAQIFLLTDLFYAHLRRKVHLEHGLKPKINGAEAKVVLQ